MWEGIARSAIFFKLGGNTMFGKASEVSIAKFRETYVSVKPSCGCTDHIFGKERAKPMSKQDKKSIRKRKKRHAKSMVQKYRKSNSGSRVPVASLAYTGPRIKTDFGGWLRDSKLYWERLREAKG